MKNEQELKNELTELFKNGCEEVYFRDDDDNFITEKLRNCGNDDEICYISAWNIFEDKCTRDNDKKVNLHYDYAYWGSDELWDILRKYNLDFEWENSYLAILHLN